MLFNPSNRPNTSLDWDTQACRSFRRYVRFRESQLAGLGRQHWFVVGFQVSGDETQMAARQATLIDGRRSQTPEAETTME
jgi:hypothetical protein